MGLSTEEAIELHRLKDRISNGGQIGDEGLKRYKELKAKKKRGSIFSAFSISEKSSPTSRQSFSSRPSFAPRLSFFGSPKSKEEDVIDDEDMKPLHTAPPSAPPPPPPTVPPSHEKRSSQTGTSGEKSLTPEESREYKKLKKRLSSGETGQDMILRYKELKKKKRQGVDEESQVEAKETVDGVDHSKPAPMLASPRMSFFSSSKSIVESSSDMVATDSKQKPLKRASSSFFGPTKAEKLAIQLEEQTEDAFNMILDELAREELEDVHMDAEEEALNMKEKLLKAKKRAEKQAAQQRHFEEERLRVAMEEARVAEEEARIKADMLARAEKHRLIKEQAQRKAEEEKQKQEKEEEHKRFKAEIEKKEEEDYLAKQARQKEKRKKKFEKPVGMEPLDSPSSQPGFWGRLIGRNKPEPIAKDEPPPAPPQAPISPIKKKKPPPKGFGRSVGSPGSPRSITSNKGMDEEARAIEELLLKAQMTTKFAKRLAKNARSVAQSVKESEDGKNAKSMSLAFASSQKYVETVKSALSATEHAASSTKRCHVVLRRLLHGETGSHLDGLDTADFTLAGNWPPSASIKTTKGKLR